jgi:hypothetical protein
MESSPRESRFDTYAEYREAVTEVVGAARSQLAVFDVDLAETGLESRAGASALSRFLLTSRSNRLRIVLHKPESVANTCPRLADLLKRFGHNAWLRQSPDDLLHLAERFIVADGCHMVTRFHADHARGKVLIATEAEAGKWQRRFDELWEIATEATGTTSLGL